MLGVWEWCKNVWYSSRYDIFRFKSLFENDVKMYGTQADIYSIDGCGLFENDVKMYGTQAIL